MSARGRGRKRSARSNPVSAAKASKRSRQSAAHVEQNVAQQNLPEQVEIVSLSSTAQQDQSGNTGNLPPVSQNNFIDFEQILQNSGIVNESMQTAPIPPRNVHNNLGSVGGGFDTNVEIEALRCGGDEMAAHVPHSICQKIWQNQYINLALLNKGSIELHALCAGSVLTLNPNGTIESKPKVLTDKVPTIERWTDAMIIFMSIYIRKHPDKAAEMLQYISIIREAAHRNTGLGWRTYDEQFRLRQALSLQPWGKIHADLWLRTMSASSSNYAGAMGANDQPRQKVAQTGTNPCFDFNKGFCHWSPCKYQHICSNCGDNSHGKGACFRGPFNQRFNKRGNGGRAGGWRARGRGFTRPDSQFKQQ